MAKRSMLDQFAEIKAQHPDTVLFFRMGDFYEMFYEDAEIASEVLGITLTSRDKNADDRVTTLSRIFEPGRNSSSCSHIDRLPHALATMLSLLKNQGSLTSRDKNADEPVPMAGVPWHSVESYLQGMLRAGHKVTL